MAVERREIDTNPVKECGLPVLWILGGPSSGKTTQSMMLAKVKEYISTSPSDLIKQEIESGSTRGQQISKLVDAGEPLPNPVIIDLIAEDLVKKLGEFFGNPDGKAKGILIDGFPDSIEQAQEFMARLCPVTKIIHISLDPFTTIDRLMKAGSTNQEANEKACAEFQKKLFPLLEKYKDKVIEVDGSEMSFLITADITSALMKFKL